MDTALKRTTGLLALAAFAMAFGDATHIIAAAALERSYAIIVAIIIAASVAQALADTIGYLVDLACVLVANVTLTERPLESRVAPSLICGCFAFGFILTPASGYGDLTGVWEPSESFAPSIQLALLFFALPFFHHAGRLFGLDDQAELA